MVTKLKSSAGKHRRSRIRAGSRRLRVRQTKSHEIHYDATQYTGKDGTLDLRMRQAAIESASENHLEGVRERAMILSASHLKRAKMMFLYARYPNSSMLKSHFPDVIFTRATTAQMVKWFSNFREFFYIQIEKWARQCNANRCPVELAVKITRGHELFQCLEGHYNRDQELPTPEDFLVVTQIAVQEFVEAVVNRKDRDPTWKKNIYKTVALLDKPFPDFLKFLKLGSAYVEIPTTTPVICSSSSIRFPIQNFESRVESVLVYADLIGNGFASPSSTTLEFECTFKQPPVTYRWDSGTTCVVVILIVFRGTDSDPHLTDFDSALCRPVTDVLVPRSRAIDSCYAVLLTSYRRPSNPILPFDIRDHQTYAPLEDP
ncbi:prospero homeobox protein 2 [Clonorchis sinensis]|uniref:Prospero homeobox protein 2 n=1 Tax=Clonorchis sinensis TaxID=79923 RepID=G7YEV6_CLOSI|nr:prospero homeobox protein 2 [Clonorchis sinensis]